MAQTAFNEAASQVDWASIVTFSSLDEKVDRIAQRTLNLNNQFCLLRRFILAMLRLPWFSGYVKKISRDRDRARSNGWYLVRSKIVFLERLVISIWVLYRQI